MNGSPGALGGAFIPNTIEVADMPKARGWWGHAIQTRFKMDNNWKGSGGISEFRLSNPPPVLAAPLYASLEGLFVNDQWNSYTHVSVFSAAGMDKLRAKGLQLSSFMIQQLDQKFGERVKILTPRDDNSRGCQG